MFDEPLHVGRPNIGDRARLRERIEGALDRHYLSNGPLVVEFERKIAEVAGTEHAIAVCNATIGIQVAVKALGLGPGDEVIIPTFTAPPTAHALSWIGLVPVFSDVDEDTGNIDPAHAEKLIGPNTRAIMGVHIFGRPCAIDDLTALGEQYGLPVLFDAAHAIGNTYRGRAIGGFGIGEIFSFHATKYINSFDGGAIVTNDKQYADRVRAMRNYGIPADRQPYTVDSIVSLGTNAKLSEPSAAMGLTGLEDMERFAEINRRNYERYVVELAGVPGIRLLSQLDNERANHQYVAIEIDPHAAGTDREGMYDALVARNVLVRRYFYPTCHQLEPYRGAPDVHARLPLPRAETLADRVLALPTGTAVGLEEVAKVCEIIRNVAGKRRR
ncbi:DegT/DnrJ/EryC1/StrS family aminotransferase [Actinocrispum wychmicini]|uniref:dTDP-4-amino-4,6-dideoxygalactose transaminase n=1 Tax=Actinocrispum wychmicini TaxID=1213861 RepID=A0A4R2K3C2_9PSEU|nr:DegT/DnrJ/EryC1/StrS family aminotransferase [Actinocrispum wychmicini]TCO60805.1 dTDP-4-amino-4,6-dideoxygalactose transaminase [Actinocrispum wychmicini]